MSTQLLRLPHCGVMSGAVAICRAVVVAVYAVLTIAFVEALVRTVPLPKLAAALGCRLELGPSSAEVARLRLAELPPRAQREIGWSRRVALRWPFGPGPCLRESLVVGHLLRRYDPVVRLGLDGSGQAMLAHAWVEVGGRPLEDIGRLTTFQSVPSDAVGDA